MEERVKIVRYAPLTLRKNIGDEGDSASLSWSIRGIYPRITVYTSNQKAFVEGKPNYDHIVTAPFDIVTLGLVLDKLEDLLEAPNNTRFSIDCLNLKVKDGVRTNELFVQATVIVGKDDTGLMYIAATEQGKKKIKFELLPNTKFFTYYDNDDNKITDPATLSSIFARSYLYTLRNILYRDVIKLLSTTVDVAKPNIQRQPAFKKTEEPIIKVDEKKLIDVKDSMNKNKSNNELDDLFT